MDLPQLAAWAVKTANKVGTTTTKYTGWIWLKKKMHRFNKQSGFSKSCSCIWVRQKPTPACVPTEQTHNTAAVSGPPPLLPASSAAVLLDSGSSPAASNSLTKFEGNTPDLPLMLPLHQPSSTWQGQTENKRSHLLQNSALIRISDRYRFSAHTPHKTSDFSVSGQKY